MIRDGPGIKPPPPYSPTPAGIVGESYTARLQMIFWIFVMVVFVVFMVGIDIGIVPGVPDFARGFWWLALIAGIVMWSAIFYVVDNVGFFGNVLFTLGFFGLFCSFLFYGGYIIEFMEVTGLWDLLDISPSIAGAATTPAQAEPITAAFESTCQIYGPDLSPIAGAPGRQAAQAMLEIYESVNPGQIYRIACVE